LIDQQTIVSTRRCDMFSKTIQWKASGREALTVGNGLRVCLGASALALACVTVAGPAVAQSRFDGTWSVVIMTRGGACQSGLRYGVQIVNGQVIGGGGADVHGRVSPRGGVAVSVSAGGQWASGSGHLNMMSGGGVWRGQGNAGYCQGTWVAQRTGYGAQAMEGPEPGPVQRPLYNYAPNYAPRYYMPPGGGYYGYYGAPAGQY
jgi:hypothetical protein